MKLFLSIVLIMSVVNSFAITQPKIHLNFNNSDLTNIGSSGGAAESIGAISYSATSDPYLNVSNSGIKVGFNSSLYGVSFYFKSSVALNNASTSKTLFASKDGPGIFGCYIGSVTSYLTGELVTLIGNTSGGSADKITGYISGASFATNEWHHAFLRYNEGKYDFFIDGGLVGTSSALNGDVPLLTANTDTLTFGIRNNSSLPFNGGFEDIKIYDTQLNTDDVRDIFNDFINFQSTSPLVHLNFNNNDLTNTGSLGGSAVNYNTTSIEGSANKYLKLNGGNGLNIPYSNNSVYAFSYWVKPTNQISATSPLSSVFSSKTGPGRYAFYYGNLSSSLTSELVTVLQNNATTGSLQNATYASTDKVINSNQWHHVLINYNTSTAKYDIYYDGVSFLTSSYTSNTPLFNTSLDSIFLGIRADGMIGFEGAVDEINFYGSALNLFQIRGLFYEMREQNAVEPIVDLNFNEGNLVNTGVSGESALPINTITFDGCSNDALQLNGSNGIKLKYNDDLYGFSMMFKPNSNISAATSATTIFASKLGPGRIASYFGNMGTTVTNELVTVLENSTTGTLDKLLYTAPGETITNTSWHNLFLRYNGATYDIYIDGIKKTTSSAGNGATELLNIDSLSIGLRMDNLYGFSGLIDNVKMYDVFIDYPTFVDLLDNVASYENTFISNTQYVTTCNGTSYFAGGSLQTSSGTYYDTLSVGSCKNVTETILNFTNEIFNDLTYTICEGDSVDINGTFIHSTQDFIDTLTAVSGGCDSIVAVHVIMHLATFASRNIEICDGESILLQGLMQTEPGTYYDTLLNVSGCDSIVTSFLAVHPLPNVVLNALQSDSICDNVGELAIDFSPAGGNFFGGNVLGSNFNPLGIGYGIRELIYTYTDANGCSSSDSINFFVKNCSINDGAIACYNFDGNANNATYLNLDGTVMGNTTQSLGYNEVANSAYYFDGVEDYIIAGNHQTYNNNIDVGLTLSAWINVAVAATADGDVISQWNNTLSNDAFILMYRGVTKQMLFGVGNGLSAANGVSTPTNSIVDTTWYYVTATWDTSGAHRIYLNGNLSVTQNLASFKNINHTSDAAVWIGGQSNNIRYFNGAIDNVKIYGRALNPVEVNELYQFSACENFVTESKELPNSKMLLYPNPANSILNIHLESNSENVFFIYDLQGKQIIKQNSKGGDCSIDIKNLMSGAYLLRAENNNGIQTKLFIKE